MVLSYMCALSVCVIKIYYKIIMILFSQGTYAGQFVMEVGMAKQTIHTCTHTQTHTQSGTYTMHHLPTILFRGSLD